MKIKWTSNWDDSDTLWCPTQLFRKFIAPNGEEWKLYCRWRHSDPWTFSIILDNDELIFIGEGLSESDSFDLIHIEAERLLEEWMKNEP